MSNNKLGRKALALGALTGLGLSFLGAAPATAAVAGSLSLLPANGTGYGTLENVNPSADGRSNIFTLKTTISSDVADFTDGELKYQIKSDGSEHADFYVGYGQGSDNYNDYYDRWYGDDNGSWSSVSNARLNSGNGQPYVGTNGVSTFYNVDSDGVVVSPNEIADYADGNWSDYGFYESNARHTVDYFSIGTFTRDHNVNAIVTAFIDTNNNDTLDADEEVVSTTRTVNFYKPSAITQTTTWTQPKAGDTSLVVHTTYSPELNTKQITDNEYYIDAVDYYEWADHWDNWNEIGVDFGYRGADSIDSNNYLGWAGVDTSSDNKSTYGYIPVFDGTSYTAKPWIYDFENDVDVYGAEVNTGVRSDKISQVTLKGVYSADEYTNFAVDVNDEDPYTVVRAGKTANIDAATYFYGKRSAAGIPVTVTLHDDGLEDDSAVTAGGKTLSAGGDDVSYDTVTDANGHVAIAVTGGVAGDDITVTVEYGNGYHSDTLSVSWQKADIYNYFVTEANAKHANTEGESDTSIAVTRGGSVSVSYSAFDQFGQPYAGTDYRVRFVSYGDDETVDSAKIVNGKASFTFTDASTAINPDYDVRGYLEKINTGSQNYVDWGWSEYAHIFSYVGGPAAASVTAEQSDVNGWYDYPDSGVKSQLVSYNDFAIGDFRGIVFDNPAYIKSHLTEGLYGGSLNDSASDDRNIIIVSGQVLDANNVPVSGAKLTFAGKGLAIGVEGYADAEGGMFENHWQLGYVANGDFNGWPKEETYFNSGHQFGEAVIGQDTLTAYADETGRYEVAVASHTAGATDLTVSAAGKTTTTTLHYVTAIHHDAVQNVHAAKVVTTGSQSLLAGTTSPLTTTVTDKFGNVLPNVDVKYAVSGNAVISGYGWTDGGNGTNDKGQVTASIIAGSNDIGTASITVSLPYNKFEVDGLNSYLNHNWDWYDAQYYLGNGYNDYARGWLQPAPVADTVVVNTYGVETAKVLKTSKRIVTASWSFAKGKSVLVVVDGYRRYHQTELSNAENSFSKKLAKGKHTISIYINGLLLDRLVTKIK